MGRRIDTHYIGHWGLPAAGPVWLTAGFNSTGSSLVMVD